jgi:2-polyprenyl-3-methyl-5-hydroxy-6-metoxy-1,4-benzoquinol methylase
MSETTCKICGKSTIPITRQLPYTDGTKKTVFYEEYSCCKYFKQVKFVSQKTLNQLYGKTYIGFQNESWRGTLRKIFGYLRAWKYRKYIYNKSILEVGTGTGQFLESASYFQPKYIEGTEISKSAVTASRLRDNITCTPFELFKTKKKFDTIFLFHVIEHFNDPLMVVKKCKALLKPGGNLIMETPNYVSWDRLIFGDHWFNWSVPYHLWLFSPRSLERLIKKYGIKQASIFYSRLPNTLTFQFRHLNHPIHKLLSPLYWGAYSIVHAISSFAGQSDAMTIIGERDV